MTVKLRVLGLPQILDTRAPGLQFMNEILGRISFLNISNCMKQTSFQVGKGIEGEMSEFTQD